MFFSFRKNKFFIFLFIILHHLCFTFHVTNYSIHRLLRFNCEKYSKIICSISVFLKIVDFLIFNQFEVIICFAYLHIIHRHSLCYKKILLCPPEKQKKNLKPKSLSIIVFSFFFRSHLQLLTNAFNFFLSILNCRSIIIIFKLAKLRTFRRIHSINSLVRFFSWDHRLFTSHVLQYSFLGW